MDLKSKRTNNTWSLFVSIASGLVLWISNGTEPVCFDFWVPLPGIGYLRWDMALWGFLVELLVIWKCCQGNRLAILLMVFVLLGLPNLPTSIRPLMYLQSPEQFVPTDSKHNLFGGGGIRVLDFGLTREQTHRLAAMVYQHRMNWTHATTSQSLAYMQLGASINFDEKSRTPIPFYSFYHGFGFQMTEERAAREGQYRLHFPEVIQDTQDILRREVLPVVRPVYARALHTTADKIIFGDDFVPGLGLPSMGIMMPNVVWHWLMNPHVDRKYVTGFRKLTGSLGKNCTENPEVQAFIMPVTVPDGAGLRYWRSTEETVDILYEIGKLYNFDASTVHAILPLPYKEWRRREIRIVLQAFAVGCDDGRWIMFH